MKTRLKILHDNTFVCYTSRVIFAKQFQIFLYTQLYVGQKPNLTHNTARRRMLLTAFAQDPSHS